MSYDIGWSTIWKGTGVFIAVIAGYHGLNHYIDGRIQEVISTDNFQEKLARKIRPSVVFNETESILLDSGAMAYLHSVAVERISKNNLTITIAPKELLGVEPVVEALDGRYVVLSSRGKGYNWVFELKSGSYIVDGMPEEDRPERFRLELIR